MFAKKILAGLIASGCVMVSTAAMAADSGWYVGVNAGQSKADIDKSELDSVVIDAFFSAGAPVLTGSSTLEDTDTSFGLSAGYRFNPYFSLEGGYINLATADYVSVGTVNPPGPATSASARYTVNFEGEGVTLAAIGSVPIGERFDLHARVGTLFAAAEVTQTAVIAGNAASDSSSKNTQEFLYGIGAGLELGAHWKLSVDWVRFNDVGDEEETGEADVDNLSLSLSYHF